MSDFIYLNNGATSFPKAPGVSKAVAASIDSRPGAAGRGGFEHFDVFAAVRESVSGFLGVRNPECIALGCNATWALNLALFGYPLSKGDCILTTKSEHNSTIRPLYDIERRGLASVVYCDVDATGRIDTDEWAKLINEHRPKLAVFTHASNVTGAVNDVAELTRLAKTVGADVLLDASQTCGWIDILGYSWNVDMIVFTGHKYLLGPQGTGGLYVRPGLSLSPYLIGGTGSHSDLPTMPEDMPTHLEAGTGNEPSYHGLLAALKWLEENPFNKGEVDMLLNRLRTGLINAGADVIVPDGLCTPVVSFTISNQENAHVAYILEQAYDIVCRVGLHCAPLIFENLNKSGGTVRLSLSRFTTFEEVEVVIGAVEDIVNEV